MGGYRIRAILGAPGGQIIGFDQDAWVTALHYDKRDLRKSLEQYRVLREANLALLKTLTPEWNITACTAEVRSPSKPSSGISGTTSITSALNSSCT